MMNQRTQLVAALLLGAGGLIGCSGSGSNVNIGDTSVIGSRLADYAAIWDGYVQAYSFYPDNSDRIQLKIDGEGRGIVQVGDSALLSPPSDPSVGYPLGIRSYPDSLHNQAPLLAQGFQYPVYAAQVQTARIQLGINPYDLWAAWCALQTSYPLTYGITLDDGGPQFDFICTPDYPLNNTPVPQAPDCSFNAPNGQVQGVDCDKLYLCEFALACMCTGSSCAGRSVAEGTDVSQYPVELDAALDSTGKTLTGTLNLDGNRITVVMQRQ